MRLIADIGGTNARFGLVMPGQTVQRRWDAKTADYRDFRTALIGYLDHVGQPTIDEVCIDVAGPVSGGTAALTNGVWTLSETEMMALSGATRARLFNDLEAFAFAVPYLGEHCAMLDQDRQRPGKAGTPGLVIAPGTGLGAALYAPPRSNERMGSVFGTEAGHPRMVLASGALLECLAQVVPADDQTPETFLSGPGLTRIDRAINGSARSGEEIARLALAGDVSAGKVIAAFLDMLARFCGAAVLFAGSLGGVYLAGGIVRGVCRLIDTKRFRELFNDHPPMTGMLDEVPVYIVSEPDPALLGLANYRFT